MLDNELVTIVASANPIKVAAAGEGVRRLFPGQALRVQPVSVPSGVADQPLSDEETLIGATNRVCHAVAAYSQATFWIGIGGGVQWHGTELSVFAWVVVRAGTGLGKVRSGTFFLPKAVAELVAQGLELGEADDRVF